MVNCAFVESTYLKFHCFQELSKKQLQLEQAHGMLLKHHEKTQDLEYKQQKNVHSLREDQVIFKLI